jgi:hypothetical protein
MCLSHVLHRAGFTRAIAAILIGLVATTGGLALEAGSFARDKAIRECSAVANKFKQRTWGAFEHHQYRTCMKRHDQKE